uniref:Uncharacterized protein n=1 Tax=Acrobeloides nanus TaxID=290746 RepID=A0A914CLR1_9BILA
MEKHICLDHRQDFDNNFDCIQKSQMNHRCTKKCEDEAKNLVDLTAEATEELHFNEANIWEFRYKNRMCHLQTCYYECRMHLIDNKCHENEKVETKKVIRSYYSAQNLDEWEEYRKANMTTLFPRLCRRFLPTEYQVHSEPENCQRSMIPDADFLDCSEVGVISKIREIVESTIYRSSG